MTHCYTKGANVGYTFLYHLVILHVGKVISTAQHKNNSSLYALYDVLTYVHSVTFYWHSQWSSFSNWATCRSVHHLSCLPDL